MGMIGIDLYEGAYDLHGESLLGGVWCIVEEEKLTVGWADREDGKAICALETFG